MELCLIAHFYGVKACESTGDDVAVGSSVVWCGLVTVR